jgi:predicted RNase H-like nuclease (RuvC/YqgF family)
MEDEGGSRAGRTEEQVEEIERRTEAELFPLMVERIRAHIPVPSGATLREALTRLREKELATALERKNAAVLKAYRPD